MKFKQIFAPMALLCGIVVSLLWCFTATQVAGPDRIQELARQTGAGRNIASDHR